MPQPNRFPCHVSLEGLANRPEHAEKLGQIVCWSGRLESLLGWTLALFSRGSAAITVPMFNAVTSTDAQRAMLLVAAKQALQSNELDAFNELMEDFRPRYGERNKLVHNLWGHSDDYPDRAVWCKAADVSSMIAEAAAFTEPEQLHSMDDFSTKCVLYSVQDLNDVGLRLSDYTLRVNSFLGQLMQNHPVLAAAANASTNAQPMGGEPQLDLHPPDQTDHEQDQPED